MDGNLDHEPRLPVPAASPNRATALSGRAASAPIARRRFALLACASLGLLAAAMSMGCLITDPPQFTPPKHSQPFLDAETADPDPNDVYVVKESEIQNGTKSAITFSADVTSQEDPADATGSAFQRLEGWLYIDYGSTADPLVPFSFAIRAKIQAPASTGGKRRVSATWRPGAQRVDPGCHRATLVVSHIFDDWQCPVCPDDSSSITWQILRCDDSNQGECDSLPLSGQRSCEGLTNSCAQARALQSSGDVLQCPEGSALDGGAQ